jgi:hypothetical protein
MDGDAEVVGDRGQGTTDVASGSEPQLVPVHEPGSEGLGDQPPARAVTGGDRCLRVAPLAHPIRRR